jgi:hypothetical protein
MNYALLSALVAVLVWLLPGIAPRKPARAPATPPFILTGLSRLDLLRNEAASGDELSNRDLSNALLDRYDLRGDPDDLYEAMDRVDRRLDVSGNADLSARIVAYYCGHRVVRWHWFCLPGE